MINEIFMSYRRRGGEHLAGRVADALRMRGFSVFMDVDDLKGGKFDDALLAKIREATNFLVVLTPGCLDRCENKGDWLRREIAEAIRHKRNIVPILSREFQMPSGATLPSDIAELTSYQHLPLIHELFDACIDKLVHSYLVSTSSGVTSETSSGGAGSADGGGIVKDTWARLALTTDPPGAAVWIDDVDTCLRTPCEHRVNLKKDLCKAVYLELKRDRYEVFCGEVNLLRGEIVSVSATLVPGPGAARLNPIDGAEMVFVPAGEFTRGSSDEDADASSDEKPARKVYLDGYWIYKYPVTVAQYKVFCAATGREMPNEPPWGWVHNHPIVNVTWDDAAAYAVWAHASLPTEAQWEKAARGTDGRTYPWGNEWDPSRCAHSENDWGDLGSTRPVGSYKEGASPYGVMDMAGNVWEWCADWYGEDYYKSSPASNPVGPVDGIVRVVRGGSWDSYDPVHFRAAICLRDYPANKSKHTGFSCSLPPV